MVSISVQFPILISRISNAVIMNQQPLNFFLILHLL
jgi:hypothetical protein